MPVMGERERWREAQDGLDGAIVGGRHVGIDGDFDEERAGHVGERTQQDAGGGDGGLQLVGAQVGDQTAHQAPVVDLADDVVIL